MVTTPAARPSLEHSPQSTTLKESGRNAHVVCGNSSLRMMSNSAVSLLLKAIAKFDFVHYRRAHRSRRSSRSSSVVGKFQVMHLDRSSALIFLATVHGFVVSSFSQPVLFLGALQLSLVVPSLFIYIRYFLRLRQRERATFVLWNQMIQFLSSSFIPVHWVSNPFKGVPSANAVTLSFYPKNDC